MKEMTPAQKSAIESIESQGDICFEKQTFDSCLSALDKYVTAQMELYKAANDEEMPNAKPYPFFNSQNVTYKAWYAKLNDKMSQVNSAMADPKTARRR